MNHFEGTSPRYFLAHDYTYVEKLTFACAVDSSRNDPTFLAFKFLWNSYTSIGGRHLDIHIHWRGRTSALPEGPETVRINSFGHYAGIDAPILSRVEIAPGAVMQSHSRDIVPLELLQLVTVTRISVHPSDSSISTHPQHLRRVICGPLYLLA